MLLEKKNQSIIFLALTVLTVGIQIGVGLSLLTLILPPLPVVQDLHLFLKHRDGLSTEYELIFYRLSIAITLIIALVVWLNTAKYLNDEKFMRNCKRWIVISIGWVSWQAFAIFKLFLPDVSPIVYALLVIGLVGQFLSWVFFVEINKVLDSKDTWQAGVLTHKIYPWIIDILAIISVVVIAKKIWVIAFYACAYILFRLLFQRPLLALAMMILAMKWGLYRWMASGTVTLTAAPAFCIMACALFKVPEQYRLVKKIMYVLATGILVFGLTQYSWIPTDASIFEPLKLRHFGAFLMVFVVPIVYVAAVLYGLQQHQNKQYLLMGLMAIYGIIEYVYFLIHPVITSFYGTGCVWATMVGMLILTGMNKLPAMYRIWVEGLLVVASILFLITNRVWLGLH